MNRKVNLDLIRIIGALMILGVHIFQKISFGAWMSERTAVGAEAVYLFFMLSGYCICESLECNDLKNYAKKRAGSIFPALWLNLILWFGYETIILKNHYGFLYWLLYFTGFNHMISNEYTGSRWYGNMGSLWTMTYFMVFYFIAPLLYQVIKNVRGGILLCVIFFGLNLMRIAGAVPKLILNGCDILFAVNILCDFVPFSLGMLLYYAKKEKKLGLTAFVLLFLCILSTMHLMRWNICFFVLIALGLMSDDFLKNDKLKEIITICGKNSFLLYLVHPFILEIYDNYIKQFNMGKYADFVIVMALVFISTLIEAAVLNYIMSRCHAGKIVT